MFSNPFTLEQFELSYASAKRSFPVRILQHPYVAITAPLCHKIKVLIDNWITQRDAIRCKLRQSSYLPDTHWKIGVQFLAGRGLASKYDIQASSRAQGAAHPAAIDSPVFSVNGPEHEINHSSLLNSRTCEAKLITQRCLTVNVKFNRNSLRDFSKCSAMSNRLLVKNSVYFLFKNIHNIKELSCSKKIPPLLIGRWCA